MKLTKITELEAFRAVIAACEGDVYLLSPSGDKFNLKSLFSQYLALGALLSENGDVLELFCDHHKDEGNFFRFFREYPEVL